MSDESRTAMHEAVEAHLLASPSPTDPDLATLAELHAAARAHLDDVDPGYFDRIGVELAPGITLELEPHQRFVLPQVMAEYNQLNELVSAGEATPDEVSKHQELANELAAASQARRILEGRPLTTGVATVAAASTPEA